MSTNSQLTGLISVGPGLRTASTAGTNCEQAFVTQEWPTPPLMRLRWGPLASRPVWVVAHPGGQVGLVALGVGQGPSVGTRTTVRARAGRAGLRHRIVRTRARPARTAAPRHQRARVAHARRVRVGTARGSRHSSGSSDGPTAAASRDIARRKSSGLSWPMPGSKGRIRFGKAPLIGQLSNHQFGGELDDLISGVGAERDEHFGSNPSAMSLRLRPGGDTVPASCNKRSGNAFVCAAYGVIRVKLARADAKRIDGASTRRQPPEGGQGPRGEAPSRE